MVDLDEDPQQALLLFNRRAEAEKQAAAAAKRRAKAERAKDEAAEAVKRLQSSGGEALATAEAESRQAHEAWQDIRAGKDRDGLFNRVDPVTNFLQDTGGGAPCTADLLENPDRLARAA